jgi:dTMP kinase
MNGKFITLEGTEGAGKSTIAQFIQTYLQSKNHTVVMTREPGGTPLAEKIRALVLEPNLEPMTPDTELLLMFAARTQHCAHVIRPSLARGDWVVCDRFLDATYAYQAGGRGISIHVIDQLAQLTVADLQPECTFLLDLPVEIGLHRARSRGEGSDRFEQEKIDFFTRVRQVYVERAAAEPHRFMILDATQSLEQIKEQIIASGRLR